MGANNKKFSPNILELEKNRKMLFAHRGIGNYYPENSIDAIRFADTLNFDAIEIDISSTADKKIILFHDEDTERLLGIKSKINQLNYHNIIKYNYIFNNKISNSKVVLLEEVFKEYGSKFFYYLDFKTENYEIVLDAIDLIKKYKLTHKVIIASADIFLISKIEYDFPEINTCLEGFNSGKELFYYLILAKLKPDYYSSFLKNVDFSHIEWLKKKNLLNRRIVYGVDSSNYKTAVSLGLPNLIIDYDSSYNRFFEKNKY